MDSELNNNFKQSGGFMGFASSISTYNPGVANTINDMGFGYGTALGGTESMFPTGSVGMISTISKPSGNLESKRDKFFKLENEIKRMKKNLVVISEIQKVISNTKNIINKNKYGSKNDYLEAQKIFDQIANSENESSVLRDEINKILFNSEILFKGWDKLIMQEPKSKKILQKARDNLKDYELFERDTNNKFNTKNLDEARNAEHKLITQLEQKKIQSQSAQINASNSRTSSQIFPSAEAAQMSRQTAERAKQAAESAKQEEMRAQQYLNQIQQDITRLSIPLKNASDKTKYASQVLKQTENLWDDQHGFLIERNINADVVLDLHKLSVEKLQFLVNTCILHQNYVKNYLKIYESDVTGEISKKISVMKSMSLKNQLKKIKTDSMTINENVNKLKKMYILGGAVGGNCGACITGGSGKVWSIGMAVVLILMFLVCLIASEVKNWFEGMTRILFICTILGGMFLVYITARIFYEENKRYSSTDM
jgi:hypothetical protein